MSGYLDLHLVAFNGVFFLINISTKAGGIELWNKSLYFYLDLDNI